jgi:hypothetical protein
LHAAWAITSRMKLYLAVLFCSLHAREILLGVVGKEREKEFVEMSKVKMVKKWIRADNDVFD